MLTQKTYVKAGLRFRISELNKPAEDGVVYFTQDEFLWMKEQVPFGEEEFKCLYGLKKDNYQYNCIPVNDKPLGARLAEQYAPGIIKEIRARNAK